MASIVYLVALLVYAQSATHNPPIPELPVWPQSLVALKAVPLLCSALVYQVSIGPVVRELHAPSTMRQRLLCVSASAISVVVYAAAGVAGGLRFGASVCSDVLTPLAAVTGVAGRVGQLAFVLVVTASFPLQHYVGRVNFGVLLFRSTQPGWVFHVLCATGYVLGAYGLAATGLDLGLVIGIAGSTGGQLFLFILPGLVCLRTRLAWDSWKVMALSMVVLGCALAALSLYATVGIPKPPCHAMELDGNNGNRAMTAPVNKGRKM
jgi:amino acid permease